MSKNTREGRYAYPVINLPDAAIWLFDEVPIFCTFIEDRTFLRNIRVEPNTDLPKKTGCQLHESAPTQRKCTYLIPLVLQPPQLTLCIRKASFVETVIAPLEALLPETIEMENSNTNITFSHSFQEFINSLFVVLSSKRGGEPEAKSPRRRECRTSGEKGIGFENRFGGWAMNEVC